MSRMLKALQQIEAKSPRSGRKRGQNCFSSEHAAGGTAPTLKNSSDPFFPQTPDCQLARWLSEPSRDHARAYGELADKILSQLPPADSVGHLPGPTDGRGASLMFTSPCDGGGTTGMLVPLATVLAERTGDDVLLVDGNLRRPALAGCLGVEAGRGLADVLAGTASWQEVVRDTIVPRLRVLPGVELPSPDGRPSRPFGGGLSQTTTDGRVNWGPLLEDVNSKFRLVLIDTASLAYPEVAPIAHWCHGAYLVVRLNQTPRRAVGAAVESISNCGGRVLGSVVLGS